ncbi:MAG TPA: DUF2071 domain-containing protein [Cyclobacteriaceae bacterium]|jgi:uncharacterized protein YqjF (DUF2071 family)|nr:DUF2071 domain-containing protein [Cyclobacteriaceae bacterium]
MPSTFLHAEWRKLSMANYPIDRKILQTYVPNKTEIELWNGTCYVSLVGFMFLNTKIKGLQIPFHINFEEVNLRFYVRYKDTEGWKRGVVFIKEIVPRAALTFVANRIYKENYETMSMDHLWRLDDSSLNVEYRWKKRSWNSFSVMASPTASNIENGSEEEFITEHYWGYTKVKDKTSEYQVEHPTWKVYKVRSYNVEVDFGAVYGGQFDFLKLEKPLSVFLAEGSEIKVNSGRQL